MKKLLFFAFIIFLASCQQKKIDRMQAVQDSITQAAFEKDSAIIGFVSAMNEIQDNLDSIKQIQDIVEIETSHGTEMKKDKKEQIINDIYTINELLKKNRELVAQLQKKLGASNSKVAELQRAITILNRQIEQKDAEIATMNAELEKLHIDISELNLRVESMAEESMLKDQLIQQKTQMIDEQTIEINTAFYAFGTAKELVDNGVIEKEGGFLGIGRSLKMKEDFNKEYFTTVDIRDFSVLELSVKKVELVSTHPAGSYHFVGDKNVESLVIDNPAEFWKTSRYLIIAVD